MIKWEPGELITHISTPCATGIPEKTVWEVVAPNTIKVLVCENPHFLSYISVGETYTLTQLQDEMNMKLWEVDLEYEKASQFLLYDWADTGVSMEIDF